MPCIERLIRTLLATATGTICWVAVLASTPVAVAATPVYPGAEWEHSRPEDVGLSPANLAELEQLAAGAGCVVRHGAMVHHWGDYRRPKDVASAVKPFYTHFLALALQEDRIASWDEPIVKLEPQLEQLNVDLGYKDRRITWRHLCNQISGYGVREAPGTAFDYSDYNMALLFDTLMLKVYKSSWDEVDAAVLHPKLTDLIQCQDRPTFMAFGSGNRPGRLAISSRDFARFGLLYLREGRWKGRQLIRPELVRLVTRTPLPLSVPRTSGQDAPMLPGQRSIGGGNNQCDHEGSYSYAWWINGIRRDGTRNWPDVPSDAFGCFGHGDIRAMVVIPSLDLIVSWNDTRLEGHDKVNQALRLVIPQ